MRKIFKISSCILLSVVIVIGLILYYYYNKPERTIEKYINSMSNHDVAAVYECITSDFPKFTNNNLDYIDYIDSLNIKAVTDSKAIDYAYAHSVEVKPEYQDYPKKDIRLFNVSYYLKTIEEKATPIDSGTFSKSFILIKENKEWKIFSIEDNISN